VTAQDLATDDVQRALTLMGSGRWDESSTLLGRLLVATPQTGSLWCLLAESRLGQRNWAAAAAAARAAIGLDPDDVQAHVLASCAAGRRRRPDEALVLARTAAELAPSSWPVLVQLAQAAAVAGATEEAGRAASRAVAVAPDHQAARFAMGLVAHTQARRAGAAAGRRGAIDPAAAWLLNATARYNLAGRRAAGSPPRSAGSARPAGSARSPGSARPAGSARSPGSARPAGSAGQPLPVTVRTFLTGMSYLLILVAVAVLRSPATLPGPLARALALCGLLAPVWYAVRFTRRLEPPLRRGLAHAVLERRLLLAAGLELAGVSALLALGAGPDPADHHLAWVAGSAAALGRLLTHLESRRSVEQALEAPAPYLLGSWVLWVLAGSLAVLALVRFAGSWDDEWLWSVLLGCVAAAGALITVGTIGHRFRVAHA
jgi:hypothetical protein